MHKQVFIINGSGGVGKDTFVEFVSDNFSTMNVSSVDKVKEVARVVGWSGGKSEPWTMSRGSCISVCLDISWLCDSEQFCHFSGF